MAKTYSVVLRFKFPAWDEVDGIPYPNIEAKSKSEAIKKARRQASYDGIILGRGPYWFTAHEDARPLSVDLTR